MGNGRPAKAKAGKRHQGDKSNVSGMQPVPATGTGSRSAINKLAKSQPVFPAAKFTLSRFDWTKLETPKQSGLPLLTDDGNGENSMHLNATGDTQPLEENGLDCLAKECAVMQFADSATTGNGSGMQGGMQGGMQLGLVCGTGNEFVVPPHLQQPKATTARQPWPQASSPQPWQAPPPPPPPQTCSELSGQSTVIDALTVEQANKVIQNFSQQTNQFPSEAAWQYAHSLMLDAHVESSRSGSVMNANNNGKASNDDDASIGSLSEFGHVFETWAAGRSKK